MSRILILETAPRTLRIIERCLGEMGYTLIPVADKDRFKLEIRAAQPAIILASADVHGGSGLEMVREVYPECTTPVPVVVWSGSHTLSALKDITPVELLIGGFLSSPLDPGELVGTVLSLCSPPDLGAAARISADLRAEYEAHGLRLEPPEAMTSLEDVPFARVLWAVDHNDWSGRLTVTSPEGAQVHFWCVMGQLAHAASQGGKDLINTAIASGKLDPARVPNVPIASTEEELGLLMALRAVGMHEVQDLSRRTQDRLLVDVLADRGGTCAADEETELEVDGDPKAIPALLMRIANERSLRLGERLVQAHPDSVVVIRLPKADVIRSWGLPARDRRVLDLIERARSKDITFEQLVRVATDGDDEARPRVRALLSLLRTVGYIDFRGRPYDGDTSARLEELGRELHRVRRGNHFEVFGLDPAKAAEAEILARGRELARKYHPDTMFGQHPRVEELGTTLYSAIQESYEVLRSRDRRDAYRAELLAQGTAAATQGGSEPGKALVALKQGELYLRNKSYAEAENFFRDATLLDPRCARAFVLLGWCKFVADPAQSSVATRTIEQAIKLDPKDPDAWYYLGRIALMKKDEERAEKRFRRALEHKADHAGAARELRMIEKRSGESSERRKEGRPGLFGLFGRRKED